MNPEFYSWQTITYKMNSKKISDGRKTKYLSQLVISSDKIYGDIGIVDCLTDCEFSTIFINNLLNFLP